MEWNEKIGKAEGVLDRANQRVRLSLRVFGVLNNLENENRDSLDATFNHRIVGIRY